MAPDHPWLRRVLRSSQQLPDPLPLATLANCSLCDHLRSQTSSALEAALAPYPAAENISARGGGVALARQPTSTLSGAPLTCAPHRCRSCSLALLWCSLSSVSSRANSLSATLWTGTLFPCMVCVRGQTVRCPSSCLRLEQLVVTLCLNVVGVVVFSTISSVSKLPRVVARTPLTSGRTCGTSRRMRRPLASACVWRFMWTLLLRIRSACAACPGSFLLPAGLFPLTA
jgi:hypothetical protein